MSECDVKYEFDVREWVVDWLRPTVDLGGKAPRVSPYKIPDSNKKSALLVNNQYPGPTIEAFTDEMVCVTVTNNMLDEELSIHWHGLHMHGYPAFDGVYGVSQAGIPAQGGQLVYRWKGANPGTHFWHAHMQANQADRGLKGPIVIHPRSDPHAPMYTEDQVVGISDEWQNPAVCLRAEGANPGNPVCAEIDKASWNGVWGDGTDEYPWPLITVQPGKCHRLRFIGMMGQTQNFLISIAGHTVTLIALDGVDVQPTNVTQFNLHAGERVDVVVCADQPAGNYLVSAQYDLACFLEDAPAPNMPRVDSCNFWAFVHYAGQPVPKTRAAKKALPGTSEPGGYHAPAGTAGGHSPAKTAGIVFNTNLYSSWKAIKNLDVQPEPEKADVTYTLNVGVKGPAYEPGVSPYGTTDELFMFTNKTSWHKPATPLLHTKGECGAEGTPFITVPENATTVEVIVNNLTPTAHVLHMHGMVFSVINYAKFSESWCSPARFDCFFLPYKIAKPIDCPTAVESDPGMKFPDDAYWGCPYNPEKDAATQFLDAPLRKDMISLWRRSWAVIRFKVENPGTWIFHCHMEQHIPTGQIMAFNLLPSKQPPIPADVPTEGPCPRWSVSPNSK